MRRRENRVDSALAPGNPDPDLTAGVCPARVQLKKDHEEVKTILGQLKETKKSAPKKREALFQKLSRAGASHESRGRNLLSALAGEERVCIKYVTEFMTQSTKPALYSTDDLLEPGLCYHTAFVNDQGVAQVRVQSSPAAGKNPWHICRGIGGIHNACFPIDSSVVFGRFSVCFTCNGMRQIGRRKGWKTPDPSSLRDGRAAIFPYDGDTARHGHPGRQSS